VKSVPLSVLDLAPIVQGGTVAEALESSRQLAIHCENLGFHRFWVAEHHGMPGIASAATSLVIAQAAAATKKMRIGAGGIMLPNHSPLVIAEQFGTLESLYPGRIDLGLGRAPGSDTVTAAALRRQLSTNPENFFNDVIELRQYFEEPLPGQKLTAVPGAGLHVPLWILGSSLFGAQVAAELGLRYAFASHFAPRMMKQAISTYRTRFKPSAQLQKPYVMLGYNVFAADSEEEAVHLSSSMKQAFVQLRSGRPQALAPPVENYDASLDAHAQEMLNEVLSCSAVGTADQVHRQMHQFIQETSADELIIASMVYDTNARFRSYEIAAQLR
jgi:luciferase family oxidoreductase group 1